MFVVVVVFCVCVCWGFVVDVFTADTVLFFTFKSQSHSVLPRNSTVRFVNALHNWHVTILIAREGMFYLTTHSTHFIYGYMASDI